MIEGRLPVIRSASERSECSILLLQKFYTHSAACNVTLRALVFAYWRPSRDWRPGREPERKQNANEKRKEGENGPTSPWAPKDGQSPISVKSLAWKIKVIRLTWRSISFTFSLASTLRALILYMASNKLYSNGNALLCVSIISYVTIPFIIYKQKTLKN